MMGIVDCKQIDSKREIDACSVEAASGEASNLSWTVQKSRAAATVERKVLLMLLASMPAVFDAGAVVKMSGGRAQRAAEPRSLITGRASVGQAGALQRW